MKHKEQFLEKIKNHESVKRYQVLEKIINDNKQLTRQINELKQIQKQMINARKIEKPHLIESYEKAYNEKIEEIESYPLLAEYFQLQLQINDMIQYVVQTLEDGINEDLVDIK
ncbi:MAG TPA: hypothetical protein GXZ79_02280 [Acholeplasma sp.]|nr:hypothetical protein [Acholeplasma sp.]